MADGHLNICKDCVKQRVELYREKNIDGIRAYDRERGKSKERQALRSQITLKRRREVSGYQKCHNAVIRAIKQGIIYRSNTCQSCGSQKKIEAHHTDYTQALKVVWLCPVCHKEYHLGKTEKAERIRTLVDIMVQIKAF